MLVKQYAENDTEQRNLQQTNIKFQWKITDCNWEAHLVVKWLDGKKSYKSLRSHIIDCEALVEHPPNKLDLQFGKFTLMQSLDLVKTNTLWLMLTVVFFN